MKSRKQQLRSRASYYGDRNQGTPDHLKASRGFEAGYKAAMRDMRKIVAECYKDAAEISQDPSRRIAHRNHCVRVRLQRFLRPLR